MPAITLQLTSMPQFRPFLKLPPMCRRARYGDAGAKSGGPERTRSISSRFCSRRSSCCKAQSRGRFQHSKQTLRAQVAKAIDGKDSASIKALIDHAIEFDLVVPPDPAGQTSGVLIVPKALCEADQREIFDPETPQSRVIEIIRRHNDQQTQ